MRKIIRTSIILLCVITFFCVAPVPAYAARTDAELAFPRELAVGEIVSVQIAASTMKDAIVVETGETPRLVLLENLGTDTHYKSTNTEGAYRAYELSELKTVMDTRTTGHGSYIFNISAPFLNDVVSNIRGENEYSSLGEVIDTKLVINGGFWTRSPYKYYGCVWVVSSAGQVDDYYVGYPAGVRPAFNLRADTCLKYSLSNSRFTITTLSTEKAKAYFKKNGFDAFVSVPEGQTPVGFSGLPGYTGVFYKDFNDMFFFACTQDYTAPTNIGSLNIDFSYEMSQATFARNSTKYTSNGTLVSANVPSYETGKFGNGVHIEEATTNEITDQNAIYAYPGAAYTRTLETTGDFAGWYKVQMTTVGNLGYVCDLEINSILNEDTKTYSIEFYNPTTGSIKPYLSGSWSIGYLNNTGGNKWSITWKNCLGAGGNALIFFKKEATAPEPNTEVFYYRHYQVEQKAYATSFHESTRFADYLSYTLSNSLPNEWFISGYYVPDQASVLKADRKMCNLWYDTNNLYDLSLFSYGGTEYINMYKKCNGNLCSLNDTLTYAAGDTIDWAMANLTQVRGDLAAGMHMWYRINNGTLVHKTYANTNLPVAPTQAYIGRYPTTGYECNGVIDAVKLIDVQAQANQGTIINNAWAELLLTAASAPAADEAALLLCNFDNNLD